MILEQLDRELNRVRREKRPLSVIMCDIDRFKGVNDTHGHAVGDLVIQATARALQSQVREYDFVGRYGGEEFIILVPGCDTGEARAIAERVRARVEAEPIVTEKESLQVTASFGLASTAVAGLDAATLIQAADDALYRAKTSGRNRVEAAVSDSALAALVS